MPPPPDPPAVARYLKAALGPGPDGPSDADLLGRFVTGRDEAAFELLVWRHAGMVQRAARAVTRDRHAAEDVAQAAFLVLARKAGSIGRREAVAGWLYRVARRLAARAARRAGRAPLAAHDLDRHPAPAGDPAAAGPDLLAEVDRLAEAYRLPVLLCFFEGLTHADAAKRLGWPAGTVAGRLARAKALLRDRLTRRGVAAPAAAGLLAGASPDRATAVAPGFVEATARAAVTLAAGQSIAALVSPHTAELVKGYGVAMTGAKLLWVAGLTAVGGLVAAGGVFVAAQGPGRGPAGPGSLPAGPPAAAATPAPARVADGAQRRRSQANLKRLVAAIHNYEAAYGRLPADVSGADGKPLLSWRVELLPFLGQEALFRAFRRDEPWDGEHNLPLLGRMPDVLRVGFEPSGATHTYYQRFAIGPADPASGGEAGGAGGAGGPPGVGFPGAGGPAGGGGPAPGLADGAGPAPAAPGRPSPARLPERLVEITDGTSNTIGVIEAGPPVAWTKPENLVFTPGRPTPALALPFANTLHVAMYDGSARAFKPGIDPDLLAALIGPNDGRVLPDLAPWRARFPVETDAERADLRRTLDECTALLAAVEAELKTHAGLVESRGRRFTEAEQAEEQREALARLLESLRAANRKLREDPPRKK